MRASLRLSIISLALIAALAVSACNSADERDQPSEPRPVVLVTPGHTDSGSKTVVPDDGPYKTYTDAGTREELAAQLAAANEYVREHLPDGWEAEYDFFKDRLPYQWHGNEGIGIRVRFYRPGDARRTPQMTRYLYYRLDGGFEQGKDRYIRPDRVYGITRDFVVIKPSSATSDADYQSESIAPIFDEAFGINDANTQRYSVRMKQRPDPRSLRSAYPHSKAAVASDTDQNARYWLWVKTLR